MRNTYIIDTSVVPLFDTYKNKIYYNNIVNGWVTFELMSIYFICFYSAFSFSDYSLFLLFSLKLLNVF